VVKKREEGLADDNGKLQGFVPGMKRAAGGELAGSLLPINGSSQRQVSWLGAAGRHFVTMLSSLTSSSCDPLHMVMRAARPFIRAIPRPDDFLQHCFVGEDPDVAPMSSLLNPRKGHPP